MVSTAAKTASLCWLSCAGTSIAVVPIRRASVNSCTVTPFPKNAVPKLRADKIQIIGHTDSSGSRSTNLALSQARADAVRDYLADKGLPVSRFEAMGVGPDQPVATNATPEGRAKNRRIEFRAAR